jgi:hypothetical protein
MVVMLGATAVGGGEMTLVVESERVVELLVESVTMGSACAVSDNKVMTKIAANSFFDILNPIIFIVVLTVLRRSAILVNMDSYRLSQITIDSWVHSIYNRRMLGKGQL